MTTKIEGYIEIDHERGVIYFHNKLGYTTIRICGLPSPIPRPKPGVLYQLDSTVPGKNRVEV